MSGELPSDPIVRREKIKCVREFSDDLAVATHRHYKGSGEAVQAVSGAFAAECDVCGIPLSGQEFLLIGGTASDADVGAKVKRLRLGFCARDGCESYFYRLSFRQVAGLDWKDVLAHVEGLAEARRKALEAEATAKKMADPRTRMKAAGKIAIGVGIVLLLLIIRQWYFGGTIPLIRQAEKFQVGTSGAASESPQDSGD